MPQLACSSWLHGVYGSNNCKNPSPALNLRTLDQPLTIPLLLLLLLLPPFLLLLLQVQGVQHFATHVGKEAAEEVKDVVKADTKVLSKAAKATHSTLKSSGEAIRASGAAIGAGAAHLATAPFGGLFSHAAHKTAEHAKKETKQAVKKAVKGVKKVKRAVAKAADEKADALHDTAKAAAHAVKRASIKNDIAKRLAAMKVKKAVGAGVKAVLKP